MRAILRGLSIPEGIRALVGCRLSQLSEAGNDALIRAAVLGTLFDFAVLDRDPMSVDPKRIRDVQIGDA